MFPSVGTNITIKVNHTHDPVATLFIDHRLDRFAAIRHGLIDRYDPRWVPSKCHHQKIALGTNRTCRPLDRLCQGWDEGRLGAWPQFP
jgi:hypothetical protein